MTRKRTRSTGQTGGFMLKLVSLLLVLVVSIASGGKSVPRVKQLIIGDSLSGCEPSNIYANALVCKRIPSCDDKYTQVYYERFAKIIYELKNYTLGEQFLSACSFGWSNQIELEFNGVKQVNSHAFDGLRVKTDVRLTINLIGDYGHNNGKSNVNSGTSQLIIKPSAFRNVYVANKSQLIVNIAKYKSVLTQDTLMDTIQQEENSAVHLNIQNVDKLMLKNRTNDLLGLDSSAGGLLTNEDFYENGYFESQRASPFQQPQPQQQQDIPMNFYTNKSYSLEIQNIDFLAFDKSLYSSIQVGPYSGCAIIVKHIKSLSLGDSLFDSLMLGSNAQFNMFVESVNHLWLGRGLFAGLDQQPYSSFYFMLDDLSRSEPMHYLKIKLDKSRSKGDESEDEDGDEDGDEPDLGGDDFSFERQADDDQSVGTIEAFKSWLCLPEDLFNKAQLADHSSAQIDLTTFDMSVSISSNAFRSMQLKANAKFSVLLKNIKGHIVVDSKAFNSLNLFDGSFELWIEKHGQQTLLRGNQADKSTTDSQDTTSGDGNMFSAKGTDTPSTVQSLLRGARYSYLKLMNDSISQVFLTANSSFRFGFVNSDSYLLWHRRSFSGFHVEHFYSPNMPPDYKTNLTLEINESDNVIFDLMWPSNVIKKNRQSASAASRDEEDEYDYDDEAMFGADGDNNDGEESQESLINMPKIIKIDGYQPSMSVIKPDSSIDLANSILTIGSSSTSPGDVSPARSQQQQQQRQTSFIKSDSYLTKEFCRYFRLRPLMALIERPNKNRQQQLASQYTQQSRYTPNGENYDNFVYFTQAMLYSASLERTLAKPASCTSCLLIYLYRTAHRRVDFYSIKNSMPKCFIQLHYKENMYYRNIKDAEERKKAQQKIENNFRSYWRILGCAKITGISKIFIHSHDLYESDETWADYARVEMHCRQQTNKFNEELERLLKLDATRWQNETINICNKKTLFDMRISKNRTLLDLYLKRKGFAKQSTRLIDANEMAMSVGRSFWLSFFVMLLMVSSCGILIIYIKFNNPKRPCIRLTFKRGGVGGGGGIGSFHRLSNAAASASSVSNSDACGRIGSRTGPLARLASVNYTKRATRVPGTDDEDDNEDEYIETVENGYDELNGYEYDDEFEMGANMNENESDKDRIELSLSASPNTALRESPVEDGLNSNSSKIAMLTNRSLRGLSRLKESLLNNKELLKGHFLNASSSGYKRSPTEACSKYNHYSYNSTDSTLMQTSVANDFNKLFDSNEGRSTPTTTTANTIVTYDPANRKIKPNLAASLGAENDKSNNDNNNNGNEEVVMLSAELASLPLHVSTNPMERLEESHA
jgi:hypothetical protein